MGTLSKQRKSKLKWVGGRKDKYFIDEKTLMLSLRPVTVEESAPGTGKAADP